MEIVTYAGPGIRHAGLRPSIRHAGRGHGEVGGQELGTPQPHLVLRHWGGEEMLRELLEICPLLLHGRDDHSLLSDEPTVQSRGGR